MSFEKGMKVESGIGVLSTDTSGSPVAAVRMEPGRAYAGMPGLLQRVINEDSVEAWEEIKGRIDYIHTGLDHALGKLDEETGFTATVKAQVKQGKKLLFKPNLVAPLCIDPATHGEGMAHTTCTEWPFLAALMRWFHDKMDISYHEMALGEAASATSAVGVLFSLQYNEGKSITTEAVIEGRSGDFYGGWGFYFVRRYLAESHDVSHADDPMNGYEESVAGKYLPPGRAGDSLVVYDLNRLGDDNSRGRVVPVPEGTNFQEIILHKAIVGGDQSDPEDMKDYPGCVLVNVPRLKIHAQDLLTNATKNLGIGLYPQEALYNDGSGKRRWLYGSPDPIPGMKTELPHMPWIPRMDDETGLPMRDEKGEYIVTRTRGMPGTQADVIRATQDQGVFMVHVVDAIEAINISHTGMGVRVPEGYALASLNMVALDVLCARYCFKTVPMLEGRKIQKERGLCTEFFHMVPVARVDGKNIVTDEDIDSPLFRYGLYQYMEERGVGRQQYYVVGWDSVTESPLVSLEGHLGRVDGKEFHELITTTMYYNPACMLWDMQRTVLSWAEASDRLTGSSLHKEIMDGYDENGDGVIDYDENGKKGHWTPVMRFATAAGGLTATAQHDRLRGAFLSGARMRRYGNREWNAEGHDFLREFRLIGISAVAFMMSRTESEFEDPFFSGMTVGKGKWPSYQFASYLSIASTIYGMTYPLRVDNMSLYGSVLQYADKTQNSSAYTGSTGIDSDLEAANNYIKAVAGGASTLDFILYVPEGFGTLVGNPVSNLEETGDPGRIFTASFNGGKEVWE
ncbi:MAG: DUF362 domain-containing protein [Dehalococcoidia bacterium]|nr:DUF362 domain-containing protein [Dehalococcoidia bacterium]